MKHVSLIGAAVGCGAQKTQTDQGPLHLQQWGLAEHLQQAGLEASWLEIVTTPPEGTALERVRDLNSTLAKLVLQTHQADMIPVTIGGDHSMAIGTWSGMKAALSQDAPQALGLIWIDAHMDTHTFETTPSKAIHGMPVAVLLGAGDPTLVNLHQVGPKIKAEHIVMIGIRSFEEGEATFLQTQGVRIVYMEEVHERGFEVIFREAIEHVASLTDAFGLTVDLDAFDPADAPGVGSPEGYGLMKHEVLPALHFAGEHSKFCALEIAEYNPAFDQEDKTAFLVQEIILSTLTPS